LWRGLQTAPLPRPKVSTADAAWPAIPSAGDPEAISRELRSPDNRGPFVGDMARTSQLFRDLTLARADGSLRSRLAKLAKVDVLAVDSIQA
jgi:hypothetical protein